jgi:hypothetical protein
MLISKDHRKLPSGVDLPQGEELQLPPCSIYKRTHGAWQPARRIDPGSDPDDRRSACSEFGVGACRSFALFEGAGMVRGNSGSPRQPAGRRRAANTPTRRGVVYSPGPGSSSRLDGVSVRGRCGSGSGCCGAVLAPALSGLHFLETAAEEMPIALSRSSGVNPETLPGPPQTHA